MWEEPNWFSRWEEELPTPEELIPPTQSLITPDLAMVFDIPTSPTSPSTASPGHNRHRHRHLLLRPQQPSTPPPLHSPTRVHQDDHPPSAFHPQRIQADFELPEMRSAGAGGDEPARTLKRPRLVWTPQLHKRFVDAVAHLGIKNAVPKTIMQLMNVDGLTRENVASHLQKYRLCRKRMQGGFPSGDAATDCLFASSPVPHHFLSHGSPDYFTPFVPVAPLQHHQRVAAPVHPQQQQYYLPGHLGRLGPSPVGGFPNRYLTRQQQPGIPRVVGSGRTYAEDLDSDAATEGEGGKGRMLTLFPTGED